MVNNGSTQRISIIGNYYTHPEVANGSFPKFGNPPKELKKLEWVLPWPELPLFEIPVMLTN